MPALFTRTSSRPYSASTLSTIASTWEKSATSACTEEARPPAEITISTTSRAAASLLA